MDISELLGALLFILLCAFIINMDRSREVGVVICQKDDITHYVGLKAPNRKLKLGICGEEFMSKGEYYKLKFEFKKSSH